MNRAIAKDEELTCKGLAEALGRRVGGKPTSEETVRRWCLHGRSGVRLPSRKAVCVRLIRWGDYEAWERRVEEAQDRARQRRRDAVKAVKGRGRRMERARQELERQGAI